MGVPANAIVVPTSTGRRLVALDMLRAVAAIGVLATHVYLLNGVAYLGNRHPTSLIVNQGATGVWLFFVLSGFVISRPFIAGLVRGSLPGIGNYALRRAARILPLYWLSMLVVALATNNWAHASLTAKLSNFFLVLNLVPGQQNGTIITVWWTLSLEACFYVFVPVVAWLLLKWRPQGFSTRRVAGGVVAVWAASVCWVLAASTLHQGEIGLWLRQVFPAMLASFCPGVLLAVAENGDVLAPQLRGRLEGLIGRATVVLPVVLVLVVVGAYSATAVNHLTLAAISPQFYAVAYGLVVAWALRVRIPDRPWVRVWTWLGLISYGIYIWHAVILAIITNHAAGLPFTSRWFLKNGMWLPVATKLRLLDDLFRLGWIMLLTTAAAAVSWYLLESRLIKWSHGNARRLAAVAVAATD